MIMKKLPTEWRPLPIGALKAELAGFSDWVLCGGHSVALITGQDTRSHGDIDIGVFRSQVVDCLRLVGKDRVFLCRSGNHEPWSGEAVPGDVHDIWITDQKGKYWALQVMVFDDEGEFVVYRRDRRIRWLKKHHSTPISGIKILNPFITVLFKTNKATLEEKEIQDVVKLIENSLPQ